MISKIVLSGASSAPGFSSICKYVCGDETRAEVISSNGVRDYNYKVSAQDFDFISSQRPGKNIFHGILSFPKHEKPSNQLMKQLASEYIEELGLSDCPSLTVIHKEKSHFHAHIISCFISIHGDRISQSWIGLRGKKAAQRITKKYGLTPANKKDLSKTNLKALNKKEGIKYNLYGILSNSKKVSKSFEQFTSFIEKKGVETMLKHKRGSASEIQGISFRYKGLSFKGSEIDRSFSYAKLNKFFLAIKPELEKKSEGFKHNQKKSQSVVPPSASSSRLAQILAGEDGGNMYDFNEEELRRKKKRRRRL